MELLSKIKFYLILVTIFLIPVIFNPYSSDLFNSTKGIFLLFMSGLLLFLWGLESYSTKRLKIKLSWVNTLVFSVFIISILNVLTNTPLFSSWFGQGDLTGITTSIFGQYGTLGMGLISILALIAFYFSASTSIDSEKRIHQVLRTLSLSGVVIVIISLIRYVLPNIDLQNSPLNVIFKGYGVVNPSFPTLYPAQNFTPIGEYYLLPIFTLICVVFLLFLINNKNNEKKSNLLKYLDYLALVILVVGFVISSAMTIYSYESFSIFPYAFYILGAIVLGLLFFKSLKNARLIRMSKKTLYTPYVIVLGVSLISALAVIFAKITQISSPLSPLSVSWSSTFVALGSSLKNGFFGIGAENFGVTYLQNRPVGINNTNLIFETLNHAGNFVLEIISNYGLLGLGVFIFISIKVFLYFFKNKNTEDPYIQMLMVIFLILFVSFFILPINLTLLFVVFLLLSILSAVSSLGAVDHKNLVIAFRNSNTSTGIFSTRNIGDKVNDNNVAHLIFVGLTAIIFIASTILSYNIFTAQKKYTDSYKHTNIADENELNAALSDTASAIQSFGYSDNFYNRYAALAFQQLSNAVTKINDRITKDNKEINPTNDPKKVPTLTQAEQNTIQGYLSNVTAGLDKATQTNPLNYENYYLASRVYFELAKTSQGQYLQQASDYVNLALRLNPQNPSLYILAANIYALNNDASNARNALVTSINKFPTLDAFAQLAQLYRNLKQYDAALDTLKSAQQFVQKDSDTYKQIEDAIKAVTEDKAKDPDANKTIEATPTTTVPTSTPTPTPTSTATPTVTPKKK